MTEQISHQRGVKHKIKLKGLQGLFWDTQNQIKNMNFNLAHFKAILVEKSGRFKSGETVPTRGYKCIYK